MGNYSRDTFNELKHYVSVRLQQGVPIVDADWNEKDDIRRYELRAFLKWFVGEGVPQGSDAFAVTTIADETAAENNFQIAGGSTDGSIIGHLLVDGLDAVINSSLQYSEQALYGNEALATAWGVDVLPPLTTPPPSGRTDLVYLDVWEREVDANEDDTLINENIGIETCVRLKREWVVRVVEGGSELPTAPEGHLFYRLAQLKRPYRRAILAEYIVDLRTTNAVLVQTEHGVGLNLTPTLLASQNNETLAALRISPTFNDNGFSGVQHRGLVVEAGDTTLGGGLSVSEAVAIGRATPDYPLHVEGKIMSGSPGGAYPAWIDWSNTKGFFTAAGSDNAFFGMKNRSGEAGGGNDFDTVIYWGDDPSDHLLFESQDYGEVMRITGAGDVGIGVNPTVAKLEVNGSFQSTALTVTDTATFPGTLDVTGAATFTGELAVNNGLKVSGSVGIGTGNNTPASVLHIKSGTANDGLTIQTGENGNRQGIAFLNSGGSYTWHLHRKPSTGSNADLIFASGLNTDLANLTDRVTFTYDGKVGIGAVSEEYVLTVGGDVTADSIYSKPKLFSFYVEGNTADGEYYPVVFTDNGWSDGALVLEITRAYVHTDANWRGALMSRFVAHSTSWGHGADSLQARIFQSSQTTFIAGYQNAQYSANFVIWLRAGNTYYWRANHFVTVDYAATAKTLTNNEAFGVKTEVEDYVTAGLRLYSNVTANIVNAQSAIYRGGNPLAYENFEIYLRGSAKESTEGDTPSLHVANVSMNMHSNRGINTVLLNPDGSFKERTSNDVYGNSSRWNDWADWVNSNAANGDIVAVGSNDALRNVPGGGSAWTLLDAIGVVDGRNAQSRGGNVRTPYALLFIYGQYGVIEGVGTYQGPNVHIKTTYYQLLGQKQEAWQSVTFEDNWVNYENSYNVAGYFRDSMGVVHLRGLVKSGTVGGNATIFTLPVGYRPAYRELQIVRTASIDHGRCDIETNGRVIPYSANNGWFSLDGITFRASH